MIDTQLYVLSLTFLLFSLTRCLIQSETPAQHDSTHIEGMSFTSVKHFRQSLKDMPKGNSWLVGNSKSGQTDCQD